MSKSLVKEKQIMYIRSIVNVLYITELIKTIET